MCMTVFLSSVVFLQLGHEFGVSFGRVCVCELEDPGAGLKPSHKDLSGEVKSLP